MSDLFKKLNVLVKAKLNETLEDMTGGQRRVSGVPLDKNVDRKIEALRKQINKAIDRENELQAQVASLREEITRLDRQADEAVQRGEDAAARHLIEQMKRSEQRLVMAESDLSAHQLVAEELIQKVNMLDAAVADARRVEEQKTASPETTLPADEEPVDVRQQMRVKPEEVMKKAQERIAGLGEILGAKRDQLESAIHEDEGPSAAEVAKEESAKAAIEDDLAARRDRLSKR